MLVMKFGGTSVCNPEGVKNVTGIVQQYAAENQLLVVVSAIDKTTFHLEVLARLARDYKEDETWKQFRKIRNFHHQMVEGLFPEEALSVREQVAIYFDQIERIIRGILLLGEFPLRTYDRIVAFGELLSTCIVSQYLHRSGMRTACPDARDIVKTDASYTKGKVIWSLTQKNVDEIVRPLFIDHDVVVTQGFISSSTEGKVTTLGREGSDYSASIFAAWLHAGSVTFWEDVAGILNGDPRIETNTIKLDALSYKRAVEMTFYGASVIHPKTIKPLRNAQIPLYVKCFNDIDAPGTIIREDSAVELNEEICSRIVKKAQALIQVSPQDFSFMDERQLNRIFSQGAKSGAEINLVQISAISLTLCVTNIRSVIGEFESLLLDDFQVKIQEGLILRTYINFGEKEHLEVANALVVQRAGNKLLAVLEAES
ncbi:MAG TPA: aspartate kinase [Bacteroidetes bacterium]|nr:aspartate kinase [Bacteroidota bacterium]